MTTYNPSPSNMYDDLIRTLVDELDVTQCEKLRLTILRIERCAQEGDLDGLGATYDMVSDRLASLAAKT